MKAVSYAGTHKMSVTNHSKPNVNPTGSVGIIGVYIAPDPGAENEDAKNGIYPFHVAQFFEKTLMLGTGQAPVKGYNEYLRGSIVNGRAKPSKIVSHHIRIDEVAEAYEEFDKRIDGYTQGPNSRSRTRRRRRNPKSSWRTSPDVRFGLALRTACQKP